MYALYLKLKILEDLKMWNSNTSLENIHGMQIIKRIHARATRK